MECELYRQKLKFVKRILLLDNARWRTCFLQQVIGYFEDLIGFFAEKLLKSELFERKTLRLKLHTRLIVFNGHLLWNDDAKPNLHLKDHEIHSNVTH